MNSARVLSYADLERSVHADLERYLIAHADHRIGGFDVIDEVLPPGVTPEPPSARGELLLVLAGKGRLDCGAGPGQTFHAPCAIAASPGHAASIVNLGRRELWLIRIRERP